MRLTPPYKASHVHSSWITRFYGITKTFVAQILFVLQSVIIVFMFLEAKLIATNQISTYQN